MNPLTEILKPIYEITDEVVTDPKLRARLRREAEAAINAYIAERELETANAVRAVERARLAEVIGENTNPVRSEELHQDTYTKSELATLINGNINRIIAEQRKRAGL